MPLSAERLRTLLDYSPLAVVAWDAEFVITDWSAQAEHLFGWRRDEVVGRPLGSFPWVHPDDAEAVADAVARLRTPGTTCVSSRNRNLTSSGEVRWVDWHNSVIHDEHGRIVAMQSFGLDITQQLRTEEELRRRVSELETLFEFMPIALIRAEDSECRQVSGNPAAHALLHVPLGDNLSKTAPPDQVPHTYRAFQHGVEVAPDQLPMQRACRDGVEVRDAEFEMRFSDGTSRHIYCYAAPLFATPGDVSGCLFAALDITERKLAEQQLREAEMRFRTLADAMPQIVWAADPAGRIVLVNHHWQVLTGARDDEPMATHWAAFVHPDDTAMLAAAWQAALSAVVPLAREYRLRRADGTYGWHLVRATPVRDERGALVAWYGSSTDIDELKRMADALRDADRRKDEFIATLAHELRNPLAPIRAAVQVLKASAPQDEKVRWSHDVIARQVTHMARLLDDLLDVSRITRRRLPLQVAQVQLDTVLDNAIETSRPWMDAGRHTLVVERPERPVILDGDAIRLAQVFSNLLNNAAKYTDPGGRIELRARLTGTQVVVTVTDNGIGFDEEIRPQLFEMFTRGSAAVTRADSGLGIGLALVEAVVTLHGGQVSAYSEGAGRGSTFEVRLPRASGAAVAIDDRPADAVSPGPRRRVLVADDNGDAAESLALLLDLLGHDVVAAHDGAAAVRLAESFAPDLVLLDIGMPGMDGYEAARRIRQAPWGADITLVALTGWGQPDDRARALVAGFDLHMVKPLSPDGLAQLLRKGPRGQA